MSFNNKIIIMYLYIVRIPIPMISWKKKINICHYWVDFMITDVDERKNYSPFL